MRFDWRHPPSPRRLWRVGGGSWALVAEEQSSEDTAADVGILRPIGFRCFREAGGRTPPHPPRSDPTLSARPSTKLTILLGRSTHVYPRSNLVDKVRMVHLLQPYRIGTDGKNSEFGTRRRDAAGHHAHCDQVMGRGDSCAI